MAAAEQGDQQFLDDLLLADDHLAQLGPHVVIALLELLDRGEFFGGQVGGLRLHQTDLLIHGKTP